MADKKISILIAEDSTTQAKLITHSLTKRGIDVEIAVNGKLALAALDKKQPDFLISDVMMSEMDGYGLCRAVRAHQTLNDLPIMLFTTLYNPLEVVEGIGAGANYFLSKPGDPDMMVAIIKDHLSVKHPPVNIQPIHFTWGGQEEHVYADLNKVGSLLLSIYNSVVVKNTANEDAQKRLQEKNLQLDLRNKFLGITMHELRNPLTNILSLCELLKNEKGETPEVLILRRAVDKMNVLVNELLDISIIETSKVSLKPAQFDLSTIFEETVYLNQSLAKNKGITLVLNIEGTIPQMKCDGGRIEQVLTNFISNAIKYSHRDTKITVSLSVKDGACHFAVADQGQGIPKEEQAKLFKPFSKTTVKTTAGEASIGLGLAISKQIIEAHGGKMGCTSEAGKGSTFFASFPIKQMAAAK